MAMLRAIAAWFNARRRLIALALSGWVVLVVVGAGRTAGSDNWIAIPDLGGILLAVFGLFALLGLTFIIYMRPGLQSATDAPRKLSLWAVILLAIFVALAAMWIEPAEDQLEETMVDSTVPAVVEGVDGDGQSADRARTRDVVTLLLVGLVAAAALLRMRLRTSPAAVWIDDEQDMMLEEELEPAVAQATHRLRAGADPRLAVLAAYAGLESALAARGQPRDPAETPTEHVARVLAAAPVLAGPAVRLGRLYELARFSNHPITNDDRDSAAAALTEARRTIGTLAGDAP